MTDEPFGWWIAYPKGGGCFILRDDKHDYAHAMQRARDLHGVLTPLYT